MKVYNITKQTNKQNKTNERKNKSLEEMRVLTTTFDVSCFVFLFLIKNNYFW